VKKRAAGITPATIKASAGAWEYLPVAIVTQYQPYIQQLKVQGFWVAVVPTWRTGGLQKATLKVPLAIVIGEEGKRN
jgi:23S rRNA (guanosine2251-2'-O)-methyltransferase